MALIAGGTNPDVVVDEQGNTLLHLSDSTDMIAALFRAKANPNVTNKVTRRAFPVAFSLIHQDSTRIIILFLIK